MSNFFISIGFLITAIQIFTSKKIARAYDSTDYSLMGDFYFLSGVAALAGAILFFWLGYRSNSCGKAIKVGKDISWCPDCGKPLTKFNDKHGKKASKI